MPRSLLVPLLGVLIALTACAGPIATRVVRAPNHALADRLPLQTTVPLSFGGADQAAEQGVRVRRVPVDGGRISLRVVVIEPGAPFVATRDAWAISRRAWTAPFAPPLGTVVLLHGLWADVDAVADHAAALANAGFRCVLVDLRGHGESTGDTISFGKHEAGDISDLLRALRADGTLSGKVALLGFSYGGSVALLAAAQGAPVTTVVAVAPFARLREVAGNFASRFAGWLSWFVTDRLTDAVIAKAGEKGGFDPDADSPLAHAPRIQIPVLFIHGDHDDLVPAEQSARLAAAMPGPHSRVVIPGPDHLQEVLNPSLSLPIALPWLVDHLAPGAVVGLTGPLVGWVGTRAVPLQATWAFRQGPSDLNAGWSRPAGTRQVRTWFRVPAAWLGRDLQLDLGTIDGADETWLGPVRLGGREERGPLPLPLFRRYCIPAWAVGGMHELTMTITNPQADRGVAWAGGGMALLRLAPAEDAP